MMLSKRKDPKKLLLSILVLFGVLGFSIHAKAEPNFTAEELNYIAQSDVIQAASLEGGAPLHYTDSKGEIKGIAVEVLKEIAELSGLEIEYKLYNSTAEVGNSDSQIIFGLTKQYTLPNTILSTPYLKSETILFVNSSVNPQDLKDKRYASIQGGRLPEGIKEENVVYFKSRKESLDAVDKGKADYGYGNPYSIAFYNLQNGYKNILTIPRGKETREYAIGISDKDPILLSIINKSIESIDENRLQTFILNVASDVDRKISLQTIFNAYGLQITTITILLFTTLLVLIILNVRINKKLKIQNRRYELLSQISNEFLFEYSIGENTLILSEKFKEHVCIKDENCECLNKLKNILCTLNKSIDNKLSVARLSLPNGETRIFKIIYSPVKNENNEIISLIGKLIDISEEIKERDKLLTKAQSDGLTNLYNATTTRKLITERLKLKSTKITDALVLIDCDEFKNINDTFGHLRGDLALTEISTSLKSAFRSTDIIGRIGGDEFCAYLYDVPSLDFVIAKTKKLSTLIKNSNLDFDLTISVGIALVSNEETYESIFHKADNALYEAKNIGPGQVAVYKDEA